ncbi:VWA domain-containing protein [Roseicyclus sp. F158]|uniref:VWA domain-containing protein n=1 Tax=Tropicimonas omnivorans TaxID=3075590 RepID=A0ABU3DHN6_9RHOB|nr:VWA domain-containing protein [Roseicyclus sp. F158]MDT0683068.1 VWA domain-containing protein [Roseicyclus sp. F158]
MATGSAIAQDAPGDMMVVFDMSGSMWGQVEGVAKVEIARDAFGGLLDDWRAADMRTGLIAYGHRRKGDCGDIELLAQPDEQADIDALVAGLQPRGKTPLSDAVRQAAEVLKFTEEAATVVLLSDGVETCSADPCALGAELESLGLDFTAHVIGFDIAEADRPQLQCLANATGGQYFDAEDAGELAQAMRNVALETTAQVAEPAPTAPDTTEVLIRVLPPELMRLPAEIEVFNGETSIGTLTNKTASVPGLTVDLPLGTADLRVQAQGMSGTFPTEIVADMGVIGLRLEANADTYVLWRDRALPLNGDHTVLIANTTGVDRTTHYRVYLHALGAPEPLEVSAGGSLIGPQAGIYHRVSIPSPTEPGDYEIVPTGADGTEYARIPIPFADPIVPAWLGPRVAEPGATIPARWAGDANRSTVFQFEKDGQRVSRVVVETIAEEDGFQLPVPPEPGLYDLSLLWRTVDNEQLSAPLGQIAVGVPLPDDEAALAQDANVDTDGLAQEAEAMGGEEGPLEDVGPLHGDWNLIFMNDQRTISMLRGQVSQAISEDLGSGGLVIDAHPGWGFGPTGSFGTMAVEELDGAPLLLTLVTETGTHVADMERDGSSYRGTMALPDTEPRDFVLVRPKDLQAAESAMDAMPVDHQIVTRDERGERVDTALTWTIQGADMESPETFNTENYSLEDTGRAPGSYRVTAQTSDLEGVTNITIGRGKQRANLIVLRPKGEGSDLPLDVQFFCSEGEDCDMTMADVPIDFTLPVGWGAERPLPVERGIATFNMVTMTDDGPFYATLNQPQRSTDLGPCEELMAGTFCWDTTSDPDLMADIDMLRTALSFKAAGRMLIGSEVDEMIQKLTGDAE